MAKKAAASATDQQENLSAYFREVFKAHPKWLKDRSNEAILKQWLADHPGQDEVPERVKQNLANIKSVLRSKKRKRGRPAKDDSTTATGVSAAPPRKKVHGLAGLEEQIDDCLTQAKTMDREALADVIILLRNARNKVVWIQGK